MHLPAGCGERGQTGATGYSLAHRSCVFSGQAAAGADRPAQGGAATGEAAAAQAAAAAAQREAAAAVAALDAQKRLAHGLQARADAAQGQPKKSRK